MSWRRALARALLCGALGLSRAWAGEAEPPPPADDAPREILVMLHLPAPHYRPGSYYPTDYRADDGIVARRRLAEQLARQHGLHLLEAWPMPVLGVDCFRMALPEGESAEGMLGKLAHDRRVAWAQAVNSFAAQASADPLFPVQPAAKRWRLAELHRAATGRNVRVAVIDSGVDARHPDLAGQVEVTQNFVDGSAYAAEAHGTGVAGVIAALAGNGVGIEGVAPGARILALRACWQAGGATRCNSFTLAKALHYALMNGAQVINLSLAGPPDRLLAELVDAACARGMRVVGAVDERHPGGFPASHPGVFAAASLEAPAAPGVLAAPGRDIPTAAPGARWDMVNGSSFSAAHISGMMAVLSEVRPRLTLEQVRAALVSHSGQGADPCATLNRLTGTCACTCNADHAAQAEPSPRP
ncbi:MAG: S8 family peptidase [Gammaproteobacteria bacterium]